MKTIRNKLEEIWNDDRQSDFSNPFCSLLYTASLIYGGIIRSRNHLYDTGIFKTQKLSCPVVAVGNITAGGTGKTPLVILLANLLRDRGKRPAVLSRGYGGKGGDRINIVSDTDRILLGPERAGDEPFLVAGSVRQVPVITGADRYFAGQYAIDRFGADVLVLDDAFQHRSVFRDVNILLLDAERPFGNGCLLPRGPLREPRRALKRADMVILTRSTEEAEKTTLEKDLEIEIPGIPVFRAVHRPTEIIPLSSPPSALSFPSFDCHSERVEESFFYAQDKLQRESVLPPDFISGKRVFAFAGIANSDSFRKTIESTGGEVVDFKLFPDHHRYSKADIEAIFRTSKENHAEIILTTEKDGVKLPGLELPLSDSYMLRIEMGIIREGEKFAGAILSKLKK